MAEPTYTPEEIAAVDPWCWAVFNKVKLHSGEFKLDGHEYLTEFMQSRAKEKCVIKGTQGGYTSAEMLGTLHGLIHGRYPQGVNYLFPTSDDVTDFSKGRFNPLIEDNGCIRRYVKSTDTANLKKIGKGFLYLRGARLSQKVRGSAKESSKLRSIPVDKTVYDEYDLMDEEVREKAKGRMGHSELAEEVWLSNPTIPDFGIDKVFQSSTRKYRHFKCTKCGTWTCLDYEFPNCFYERKDASVYRGCIKCSEPLNLKLAEWVAECPDARREGWLWSQLYSLYRDPADILREYRDPDTNIGDFNRLTLGRPYIEAENKLTAEQVYHCCGQDGIPLGHRGPCAMGVDIGKVLHCVIGCRISSDQYRIVKMTTVPDWQGCHDLAKRYNVTSEVQDMYPETHKCREYQKAESHAVFLCQYSDTQATSANFDHKTGIVKVNRTDICDGTHNLVATEKRLILPRRCREMDIFAAQLCNITKVPVKDPQTGLVVYRYIKTGDDHYRHALNYFLLAAGRCDIASTGDMAVRKQTTAASDYNPLS